MKLYVYDHCPYCIRVRVVFAAKQINYGLVILLNDDESTPISMTGKKMLPIYEYGLGMVMNESLDIIDFVDKNFGFTQQFTDERRYSQSEKIHELIENIKPILRYLAHPRFVKTPVHEFSSQSSIDYFTHKKEKGVGNFQNVIKDTPVYIRKIEPYLVQLDEIIQKNNAHNNLSLENFNLDDMELFARLRSLYLVKLLSIPHSLDLYLRKISQLTKIPLLTESAC